MTSSLELILRKIVMEKNDKYLLLGRKIKNRKVSGDGAALNSDTEVCPLS